MPGFKGFGVALTTTKYAHKCFLTLNGESSFRNYPAAVLYNASTHYVHRGTLKLRTNASNL